MDEQYILTTKQNMLDAIDTAIKNHKFHAGTSLDIDWAFVVALQDAKKLVEESPRFKDNNDH